jgi:O-antigen/teichoic acid export membrane protein
MLLVNVVQRFFGLLRGIGFANFLSDVELGHWALINSFFVIAVPIAVLGLPGSFGKFAEYFRVRSQFAGYFRLVSSVTLAGVALTCILILLLPEAFSRLIFRESVSYQIVVWCVLVLTSVVAFSFLSELAASFREVRTISQMQFAQSVTFTLVGLTLVAIYRQWWVLLPSFLIAQCVGILPGLWRMRAEHVGEFQKESTVPGSHIMRRVAPYAITLWAVNLFSNLFEVGDRYMLLHLMSGDSEAVGQAAVGQYHCARILPNLLTSVAIMLGGVLLPYLSADWEQEQRQRIAAKIRQMAQGVCIGFLMLAVAAMLASPLLFQFVFTGRYQLAQQVLPIALLQATWGGLFLVSEPFMLCAERGKELAALLLLSLVTNLGLNACLIPWFGLHGGMATTAASNLLALSLLYWRMARCGCWLGTGTVVLSLAPLAIVFGPTVSSAILVGIVFIAGRTNWLLSAVDKAQMDAALLPKLHRFGLRLESLWPSQ